MENKLDINSLDAVFFDLDGTLLGLSDEDFANIYTKLITKRFADLIEPEKFMKALWASTEYMMKHNDPEEFVLESFFEDFTKRTGLSREITHERFDEFYKNEFGELAKANTAVPEARLLLDGLKAEGIKVVLATNPVFPEVATRRRCKWTEIDFDEFLYVSHAENSHACKPNPEYYSRLLDIANVKAENTLMVGNDYLFDMSAKLLGMKTWMIDKFQGNLEYKDKFEIDYSGSLSDLVDCL